MKSYAVQSFIRYFIFFDPIFLSSSSKALFILLMGILLLLLRLRRSGPGSTREPRVCETTLKVHDGL